MNPLILAVDTTGEFGSLALVAGDTLVEEVLLHSPDGFGHVLFPQLERLLARHGKNIADIDCFGAAAGPGSFTGVRVGLAAVKGLAEATGRPVAAVSNLAAVAWFGSAPLRAPLLDARRGEVYAALFDAELRPVMPETVLALPRWLEALPAAPVEFLGPNLDPFRHALPAGAFTTGTPRALAAAIARIARRRLDTGDVAAPESVDANYVRRSDAELFWRDA